ncbi:spore coat polysaccharide biosynthesis predicted glycosyltransferase SpsG [Saccharomonospora amisosensis]|uniref:Spore coat polysaccharide biosynthesis predicted glycosyltransferase SpsG n=1 Tax=Saccharomonospora amisosensis TaxID=1128677 RepID=A0A7X5UUP9_9PSEU|nr:spore coat protein [Saccharomonospora amisosensis]NIJ14599.1 spore coat polysaccharide biosynthesis predicted glycosyltransferase SpsG [Saccharomonospora amisosensis]
MKLLLRADASPAAGAGHVARMVALAEEADSRGWQVAFSGRLEGAGWLRSRLEELAVTWLAPTPELAESKGFDAVVVDHYGLGEVSDRVNYGGALLVSFEDGAFGRRRADIVVDCGFEPTARPDDGSSTVLTGVEYAPLRRAVLEARRSRVAAAPRSGTPHVLMVLGGGSAPTETVMTLLHALRDTDFPCTVDAVVAGDPALPAAAPGQRFSAVAPGPDLLDRLVGTDLAVSAAGVTLLELCCIGVPSALVRLVDNQAVGYRAAVERGLAAGLGSAEDLTGARDVLARLLADRRARETMAAAAAAVVDGRGAARVLDAVAGATR